MMNKQQSTQPEAGVHQGGVLDLNERNWLPRHCRGDEQAFEQLLLAYRNLVYSFLYRYGIEKQNRDDLFQDIFLKIHLSAPRYRPSEPLRPWLVSIVLNTVRNFRRDRGRKKHFMTHLKALSGKHPSETPAWQTHEPGLDERVEQQSTVMWLERRITALPERQREVLVLSTLKGLRMKDIAKVMALPENTVKTHLRRARLALAESLAIRENRQVSGREPQQAPNSGESS
jgi:RNA polymerase sigma factor (sigma-70 family)